MASNVYHYSSQVSGLTDHEAGSLLREEKQKYEEKFAKLEASYRNAQTDVAFYEDELDAALDEHSEVHPVTTTQTYESPAHKYKIYARTSLKSFVETIKGWWGTLVGILMIALGAVVVPAIDAAMFYNLFAQDFENEFGEITNTQAWLVILFSLQALATFLAAKFFVTTPQRREKLAVIVFALGILFAVGASLERANDRIAEHQTGAESVITWDAPANSSQNEEIGISHTISAYLLSLGFIALPLLGALLLSQGWETLIKARTAVKTAKRFRLAYKEWKQAVKTRDDLEAQLRVHAENREAIIRAPLDGRVNGVISGQRGYKVAADRLKRNQLHNVVDPLDHDDPTARIHNVDGMAQEADDMIERYGANFADAAIDKWQRDDDHSGQPDRGKQRPRDDD